MREFIKKNKAKIISTIIALLILGGIYYIKEYYYNIICEKNITSELMVAESAAAEAAANKNLSEQNPDTQPQQEIKIAAKHYTVIGDSLSEGFRHYLPEEYTVYSKIGRQFSEGIYIAQNYEMSDYVIIELGTNGPIDYTDINYLIEILRGKQIYFVTNYVDRSWEYNNNELIQTIVHKYDNVHIINWYQFASDNPYVISSDGVHCTPNGYKVMAEFIQGAVN